MELRFNHLWPGLPLQGLLECVSHRMRCPQCGKAVGSALGHWPILLEHDCKIRLWMDRYLRFVELFKSHALYWSWFSLDLELYLHWLFSKVCTCLAGIFVVITDTDSIFSLFSLVLFFHCIGGILNNRRAFTMPSKNTKCGLFCSSSKRLIGICFADLYSWSDLLMNTNRSWLFGSWSRANVLSATLWCQVRVQNVGLAQQDIRTSSRQLPISRGRASELLLLRRGRYKGNSHPWQAFTKN
jgi:hypothetical protein